MGFLFKEIRNILLLCFRYIMVTAIISLVLLSLLTGQFPPPVRHFYQNLKTLQSTMDFETLAANLKQASERRQGVAAEIDEKSSLSITVNPETANRIRALEYEVAYLKAKLAQSEYENQQLKSKTVDPESINSNDQTR